MAPSRNATDELSGASEPLLLFLTLAAGAPHFERFICRLETQLRSRTTVAGPCRDRHMRALSAPMERMRCSETLKPARRLSG
jgi:hypothetical protein